MAKLEMKSIRIAVIKSEYKQLMSFLQKAGALEVRRDKSIDGFFTKDVFSQKLTYDRTASVARQALGILDAAVPEKKPLLGFLEGRTQLTREQYDGYKENAQTTVKACYDITALDKQLAECKAEILRIKTTLDEAQPWLGLDIPSGFTGTRKTEAFIGSFPYEARLENIYETLGGDFPYDIEIISTDKLITCIFAVCLKEDADRMETALRDNGFIPAPHPDRHDEIWAVRARELSDRRDALLKECELLCSLIASFAQYRFDIKFIIDFYDMRARRYELYSDLKQSRSTVIIDGYIPEKFCDKVAAEVENSFSAAVEITDPAPDEEVPVALQNNRFARPCQSLVSMYSMPSKNDMDPTGSMAIFFYIFFGMMLSDAGYGLLIALTCFILLKKYKNMEENWRNNLTMFLYCGISTIFWGAIFGSWFGDLIPKAAQVYFGAQITVPALLNPINDALTLLILGLGLGTVHIYTGMIMKFISLCKMRRVTDAVCDVGIWLITLTGAIMAVAGMLGNMQTVGNIGLIALGIGAVGLVLTQGRSKKGASKIISGVASLYDITSYASDILSYSRLMALGLATGVFAQVINQLGMKSGVVGFILFIVVFIIGNAISLAMNALGAYVHTIRLQYVEYFSKFYDGGGRAFEPFSAATEFIKLKK